MTNIVMQLCKLTDESGMTHRELARRMEVDDSRICRYFKGDYEPGAYMLAKWAEALGCRIEVIEDLEYPFDDPMGILQERNRNMMIENMKLEQMIQMIRFVIEQEAEYNDACVNADKAKGLYHAGEIIDKYMAEFRKSD